MFYIDFLLLYVFDKNVFIHDQLSFVEIYYETYVYPLPDRNPFFTENGSNRQKSLKSYRVVFAYYRNGGCVSTLNRTDNFSSGSRPTLLNGRLSHIVSVEDDWVAMTVGSVC